MDKKETMLGRILGKIVGLPLEVLRVFYDLVEKLAGENWQEWLTELKKFLRKEKCWTGVVIDSILTLITTVTIPARTGRFVAKDHFIVDTGKKAKVKISFLGDNFRNSFLSKTEEPAPEFTLCQYELKRGSRDIPIISELGGENKAETTLSAMFGLMEMQPKGETGTLLTNGYANIFYVRDLGGVLWAVLCRWGGVGWDVGASSVDIPNDWGAGLHAFSRNS
ncbi:MAG: hypothetical protein WC587_00700 [Candidatus Paceibacterota bacterium]